MRRVIDSLPRPERVLHVAPDPVLRGKVNSGQYLTFDLAATAGVQGDLTAAPFRDGTFDLIICSHVMEHIPDDAGAFSEMERLLAVDGVVVLLIPADPDRPLTYEDSSVIESADRLREFGQEDHVRIYGRDLVDRVMAVGWRVEELDGELARVDRMFLCRRTTAPNGV